MSGGDCAARSGNPFGIRLLPGICSLEAAAVMQVGITEEMGRL